MLSVIVNNFTSFPTRLLHNEETYKPVQFYPTNPYDVSAGICNIMLKFHPDLSSQVSSLFLLDDSEFHPYSMGQCSGFMLFSIRQC